MFRGGLVPATGFSDRSLSSIQKALRNSLIGRRSFVGVMATSRGTVRGVNTNCPDRERRDWEWLAESVCLLQGFEPRAQDVRDAGAIRHGVQDAPVWVLHRGSLSNDVPSVIARRRTTGGRQSHKPSTSRRPVRSWARKAIQRWSGENRHCRDSAFRIRRDDLAAGNNRAHPRSKAAPCTSSMARTDSTCRRLRIALAILGLIGRR